MLSFRLLRPDDRLKGFCLRVPVRPLGKEPIHDLAEAAFLDDAEHPLVVAREDRLLVFTASGFSTVDDAASWLPRMVAGLWCVALRFNLAFKSEFSLREVTRASDPAASALNVRRSIGLEVDGPLSGTVEADATCIFASHETLLLIGMGEATAHVSNGTRQVIPFLRRGMASAVAPALTADERFRTAMDLYLSHFYEVSQQARLLTLVMTLEVLAPVTSRHPTCVQMLRKWILQVDDVLKGPASEDEEDALRALRNELAFKSETSIRRRIESLVRETLAHDGVLADAMVREVKAVYAARSTLAHKGVLPIEDLAKTQATALRLVQHVLAARMGLPDLFEIAVEAV